MVRAHAGPLFFYHTLDKGVWFFYAKNSKYLSETAANVMITKAGEFFDYFHYLI